MLLDFKSNHKATETKAVWYWKEQTNRSMENNRFSEIDHHKYSQLIFRKGANIISLTNGAGKLEIHIQIHEPKHKSYILHEN